MAVSMRVAELATDVLVSMAPIDTTAGEPYPGPLSALSSEERRMLEDHGMNKAQFYIHVRSILERVARTT